MGTSEFFIGKVRVSPPTVLAPLAGITNLPFRSMVKGRGCGLVCSEMISANGLIYSSDKTFTMLKHTDGERPLSIQIFGSDPEIMARAARMVEDAGADILDINFGCSVKKVTKTRSGVALMLDAKRSMQILSAVRKAVKIPLTIKIRAGWEPGGSQAFEIADIAEKCGVDALCLHPRTAKQGFSGTANWSLIGELKKRCQIPVIGNGDITTPEMALQMMRETGCDGIMIGRAALHDPDIFRRAALCLEGKPFEAMSVAEQFSMIERYIDDMVAYHGETIACKMMRGRVGALVKGLSGSGSFRRNMSVVKSKQQALDLVREFQRSIET